MRDEAVLRVENEAVHLEMPNVQGQTLVLVHAEQRSVKLLEKGLVGEYEDRSVAMISKNIPKKRCCPRSGVAEGLPRRRIQRVAVSTDLDVANGRLQCRNLFRSKALHVSVVSLDTSRVEKDLLVSETGCQAGSVERSGQRRRQHRVVPERGEDRPEPMSCLDAF